MIFGEGRPELYVVGKVLQRLAALAEAGTVEGVVERLTAARVYGIPKDPNACVVHAYIAQGWNVSDYGASLTAGQYSTTINFQGGARLVYDTPKPVGLFIGRFDKGDFAQFAGKRCDDEIMTDEGPYECRNIIAPDKAGCWYHNRERTNV